MSFISLKELLGSHNIAEVPHGHQLCLEELRTRLEKVRAEFGKPMRITSGYRSMQEHLQIYSKKGITDKSKIPMRSKHLIGCAADVADPAQELQAWCKANEPKLEEIGLWIEDFSATPNWVHFQTVPPASGKRFFKP